MSPFLTGTALHAATRQNNLRLVEMLLKYGAKVDIQDADGLTPLDFAEKRGYDDIAEVLRKQARVKRRKTDEQWTAFMLYDGNIYILLTFLKLIDTDVNTA